MEKCHGTLVYIILFLDDAIVFILINLYIDGDCDTFDISINSGEKSVEIVCIVK